MSTHDVPGARPENGDTLAMGCWAEHDDGSLIFVESTEADKVIYSIFDMAVDPPVEYRDAMPIKEFERKFSWTLATTRKGKDKAEKWTWHDKTPFPWDRIIQAGARDGARHASAGALISAASRVAQSLRLRGRQVEPGEFEHMSPKQRAETLIDRIQDAIKDLPA